VVSSKRVEHAIPMDLTYDVGGKVRLIPNNAISSGEYEINKLRTVIQH